VLERERLEVEVMCSRPLKPREPEEALELGLVRPVSRELLDSFD